MLDYAEANAALFAAIEQRGMLPEAAQMPEVELAAVAVLESLAAQRTVDWPAAARTLQQQRFSMYLDYIQR